MGDKNNDKVSSVCKLAIISAIIGVLFLLCLALNSTYNNPGFTINNKLASGFGALAGGVAGSLFALAGFMLLYETLKKQREMFRVQQFETRFFQMLQLHRDNVHEMVHCSPRKQKNISGRRVFLEVLDQFNEALRALKQSQKYKTIPIEKLISISYLATFFGVGGKTQFSLIPRLQEVAGEEANNIKEYLRSNPGKTINEDQYLGGHLSRLGHYYRHLYHCVRYVDEQSFLQDEDKRQYMKMLRAQLSNEEQICLFLNALSPLGKKAWASPKARGHGPESSLIMRYKMIKNIPKHALGDIDPKTYFPMSYEYDETAED
jgi:hypothetical protein